MTVADLTPRISYAEDGFSPFYPVPFNYSAPADIKAEREAADGTRTALVYNTDYTVTAADGDNGGELTLTEPAAIGTTLHIWRQTSRVQPTDYQTGDTFPAKSHEQALDRAMLVAQENATDIDRAPKVPRGLVAPELPHPADNDGKVLAAVNDGFGWVPNDPASAASDAARAEAAQAAVAADRIAVAADRALAGSFASTAAGHEAAAEQAAASALTASILRGVFPDAAARTNVPLGATGTGAITGGSGGTNGTFALAFSGGNFAVNPSGTFTVAGGALTAINLTGTGFYAGGAVSAPTLSFAASAGLTGASAALTTGVLVGSGGLYYVPDDASEYLEQYQNDEGTATATGVVMPMEGGLTGLVPLAQAGAAIGGALGPEATVLDFRTRVGRKNIAGALASTVAAAVLATSLVTFARAGTTYERSGPGTFAAIASGAGAFGQDDDGQQKGLAIRGARTNLLIRSTEFTTGWTRTNADIADDGANAIEGYARRKLTDTATLGTHDIRRAFTVSSTGVHTLWAIVEAGTWDEFVFALGAPFGTPNIRVNLSAMTATHIAGTAPIETGVRRLGGGRVLFYVRANATSTGNNNFRIYLSGSTSAYSGTGKYLYLHHTQATFGSVIGAPIPTADATASRAADVLTVSETDTRRSFKIEIEDDGEVPDGGVAWAWHDGTSDNQLAIVRDDDVWALQLRAGGVTIDQQPGPAIEEGVKRFALTYDQSTGDGEWAADGAGQAAVAGGPSGLTTVSLGHDGAGGNQFNAWLRDYEGAVGLATAADLLAQSSASGAGGGDGGGEATLDDTDVFIQSDGSGGYNLLWRAAGSSDGLDFCKFNLAFFNPGAPYTGPAGSPNLGRGAQGLADGGAWFVRRTGAASFGPNGQQYIDRGGAMFDSVKKSDNPEGNNYWAIVESPSEHGNMLETSHRVFVDGRDVTDIITTEFIVGKIITIVQRCECDSFATGDHVANRYGTYEVTQHGLDWLPEWQFLEAMETTSDSYTAQMGTKNVDNPAGTDNLFDLATYDEGSLALSRSNGLSADAVTNGNWVLLTGNGCFARFMVDTASDRTQGFKRGVSTLLVDEADNTNNGKAYFRMSGSSIAVAAGDTWRHRARYQFGFTA